MEKIIINIIYTLFIFSLGIISYYLIIGKKLRAHCKIEKQAFTDQLTGKFNRHKFLADMDSHIKRNKKFAICVMDLDGFKHVNDTLGHDAGDMLLIELGKMLEKYLPKNCISYRLGGDEFSIIINDIDTVEDISRILDKLKEGLKTPIYISNTKIVLEYSLGVAIYPTDAKTRIELMTYADDAMYYIKENGKNNYYFHNEALRANLENRKKMEIDLKKALERKEFGIEFQPRICLKDTSKICLEVLIYWNHPVLGKLSPKYFIKQAEEMGIIVMLDELVLRKSCEKLYELKNKYNLDNVMLALNMSNLHAKRRDFVDKMIDTISEYKFNNSELLMQFTDKFDLKGVRNYEYMFNRLNEIGVLISIPSIELRYEEMKVFSNLKIDEFKINAKVSDDNNNFKPKMIKDLVDIAKNLNYDSTITSIETDDEFNRSIMAKPSYIQGDLLFKKLDEVKLNEFILNYNDLKTKIEKMIKE